EVSATCRAAVEVARAVVAQEDEAPLLAGVARAVDEPALAQLADRLDRALDGHGGLRDDASPDLPPARRGLERARMEAADTLRRTAARLAPHLQESFLTERGGRPLLAGAGAAPGGPPGVVPRPPGSRSSSSRWPCSRRTTGCGSWRRPSGPRSSACSACSRATWPRRRRRSWPPWRRWRRWTSRWRPARSRAAGRGAPLRSRATW